MKIKTKIVGIVVGVAAGLAAFAGCTSDADVTSQNVSNEADHFQVFRQIVVYDLFTDKYVLEVEGYCSLGNNDGAGEVTYTCKTAGGYTKDIIKGGDNKLIFAHQLDPIGVSPDFYEVNFKPSSVVPDVKVREGH